MAVVAANALAAAISRPLRVAFLGNSLDDYLHSDLVLRLGGRTPVGRWRRPEDQKQEVSTTFDFGGATVPLELVNVEFLYEDYGRAEVVHYKQMLNLLTGFDAFVAVYDNRSAYMLEEVRREWTSMVRISRKKAARTNKDLKLPYFIVAANEFPPEDLAKIPEKKRSEPLSRQHGLRVAEEVKADGFFEVTPKNGLGTDTLMYNLVEQMLAARGAILPVAAAMPSASPEVLEEELPKKLANIKSAEKAELEGATPRDEAQSRSFIQRLLSPFYATTTTTTTAAAAPEVSTTKLPPKGHSAAGAPVIMQAVAADGL